MLLFSVTHFCRRARILAAVNALMLAVAASSGVAQTGAGKPAASKPAASKNAVPKSAAKSIATKTTGGDRTGNVHIRNHPAGRATYDQAKGIHRLWRDVRVTQDGEDFILYCDELTYFENTNTAIAKGNPRVETRDSTIRSTTIRADFDAKIIFLEDKVVMNSHGEKDGIQPIAANANGKKARSLRGEVLHKPSTLRCNRIDYRYEIREATLSGDILMRQGENTGTCEQIVFDEANNIAQLQGAVSFVDGKKQTIKARNLTIWIDDNVIETTERVQVDIPRTQKAKTGDDAKTPAVKRNFGKAPSIDDAINGAGAAPAPIPPLVNKPEPADNDSTAPEAPAEAKPEETKPVNDETGASSKPAPKETAKADDAPAPKKTAGG